MGQENPRISSIAENTLHRTTRQHDDATASPGTTQRQLPPHPRPSHHRDIYTNTALQLQVLDDFFPASKEHPPLSAFQKGKDGQAVGLEKLMEKYTEAMFLPGGASIQPELYEGIEGFKEDRKSLWGRSWDGETQRRGRPEALATLVGCFELLESVLTEAGKWIGEAKEVGLVDIHGEFVRDDGDNLS